jgi:hypothetical protein
MVDRNVGHQRTPLLGSRLQTYLRVTLAFPGASKSTNHETLEGATSLEPLSTPNTFNLVLQLLTPLLLNHLQLKLQFLGAAGDGMKN